MEFLISLMVDSVEMGSTVRKLEKVTVQNKMHKQDELTDRMRESQHTYMSWRTQDSTSDVFDSLEGVWS